MNTEYVLEAKIQNIIDYLKISQADCTLSNLPMYYSYGLSIINTHIFSGAKIKGDLITLKGKLEYDHFFDNDYFIMCLGTIKSLVNGRDIIQNKGYFQMRFRDDDTRRISPDGFAQYQWNGIQGMDYRALSGGNLRFRWYCPLGSSNAG